MCILKYKLLFSFLCIVFVASKDSIPNKQNEDVFKQLFKVRRLEQLEAVKKIRKLPEDKQYKMLKTVTQTIFDVISKSKKVLENFGYVPGSGFPENEAVRDALSLVLENTALVGEIVLRLPDIAEILLRSSPAEWSALLSWSLAFTNQTKLMDSSTSLLIQMASQELNITARSPDYINPYRRVNERAKARLEQEKEQVKKKKKKSEIPRGPRLTLPQAGEL